MVDHRYLQLPFRPVHGGWVGAFAREKQRAEFRKIMLANEIAVGVFLADSPERGRRSEQCHRLVFGYHSPERARIRRTDRLALIHDRGGAMEQRAVDDIAVTDHPAD